MTSTLRDVICRSGTVRGSVPIPGRPVFVALIEAMELRLRFIAGIDWGGGFDRVDSPVMSSAVLLASDFS